ncbi:response regulator transcription factor [Oceanospirillum sanctuarii]|uniref:response regulator transcription factor n=1 Tax=Oceanospirillum sanctuarii TaxID=1434821 RepID=UPI000A35FB00|nr:response regulator transcription factor [Oceanospirillum sanctuarii]
MKLLVVEDDPTLLDFICQGFREQGYTVNGLSDGHEALLLAKDQPHDAAIIDLMLPGLDGLSLIRELRASGHNLPILILSARHTVNDRVLGLETGSDDYLTKPFSFIELQARVQALLRRRTDSQSNTQISTSLQLADLTLDRISKKVTRGETLITLQPRELSLLEYLLENPGKVLSKTMILEQVWDYQFDPQTNVVDVLVCRLRSKIDKDFSPKLLHTLRGIGYVLKAED